MQTFSVGFQRVNKRVFKSAKTGFNIDKKCQQICDFNKNTFFQEKTWQVESLVNNNVRLVRIHGISQS